MNKALLFFTILLFSAISLHAQPPEMPVLTWPQHMAENVNPGATSLLWIQPLLIPGIHFFEVYLDPDPQMTAPPIYVGPAMEFYNGDLFALPAGALNPMETYHWQIKVTDLGSMLYTWSPIRIFTTGSAIPDPPEPPVPISPPDASGGHQPNEVELVWMQFPIPDEYCFDVFLDDDPDFSSALIFPEAGIPLGDNTYRFLVPEALTEDAYYWYVRVTDLISGLYSDSPVWMFYVIPSSTISGTVSSVFNVSAVTVTCPQACAPISVTVGITGAYSFTVNNGLNPVVTPSLGWPYYFYPTFWNFNNIQANQTANFWMYSLLCNPPFAPFPANLTTNVSVNINQLKWNYDVLEGYSPPTNFAVYFPASSLEPYAVVPYLGRETEHMVDIPVLQYSTDYTWKVVPYNNEGPAENIEIWSFTTENPQMPPVLLNPPDGSTNVPPAGVNLQFQQDGWVVDSFFDVFCDIDPNFPEPPAFSGPLTPNSGNIFEYFLSPLISEQQYFWKVRYNAGGGNWTSAVFNFVTGVSAAPQSKLSGYIQNYGSSAFAVWDVKMSCPGACVPKTVKSQFPSGYYEFKVTNGSNYTVYPSKLGYYFTPASHTFYNVQSNQTKNFYISSLIPSRSNFPNPQDLADMVSIDIGQLQWAQHPDLSYANPTGFEVYFPAGAPAPMAVVPFVEGQTEYAADIPPLAYGTTYDWKVVPFNGDGFAEEIETWSFTTQTDPLFPPVPVYIWPANQAAGIDDDGLIVAWKPPPGTSFPVDSFFDVFCDIDPAFPNPPVYSGDPHPAPPDPLNPGRALYHMPPLQMNTLHYWKIRVTDLATGFSSEGDIWEFTTTGIPIEHPVPELLSPPDQAIGVNPLGVDLEWEYNPWMVDSFFDVFCDIDPLFPNPPVYSGPGTPQRTILAYHMADLLAEQPYYFFCRYSDFVDYWYSKSTAAMFTTGPFTPPPPPLLISPVNGDHMVPFHDTAFEWTIDPDWMVDSFFDVFCDIDPFFTNPPIYSGTGTELLQGDIYTFIQPELLPGQPYLWFVRVTSMATGLSSDSPVWNFVTALSGLQAPDVYIDIDRTLHWGVVPGAMYYRIYRSFDPYGEFLPVGQTSDNLWLDPDQAPDKAFYVVTAVTAESLDSDPAETLPGDGSAPATRK